jgi:hypothetical protein
MTNIFVIPNDFASDILALLLYFAWTLFAIIILS